MFLEVHQIDMQEWYASGLWCGNMLWNPCQTHVAQTCFWMATHNFEWGPHMAWMGTKGHT